jgi:hypothetical protein
VTFAATRINSPVPVPFVLVGGVPGAGKTFALRQVATLLPEVRVLDSDDERRRLNKVAPELSYGWLRPLVHLTHITRMVFLVLAGPRDGRCLVVHDPSTRWVRLGLVGMLARLRGWSPRAVFVDISRSDALSGQRERGRIVNGRRFAGHWRRWQDLRIALAPGPIARKRRWIWALAPWRTHVLTSRTQASADLFGALTEATPIRARPSFVGRTLSNGVDD